MMMMQAQMQQRQMMGMQSALGITQGCQHNNGQPPKMRPYQ